MAFRKPLRIFFGYFVRTGGADYATNAGGLDALYPWFLTGKTVSSDLRIHNRRPIDTVNGDIQSWDEYLDLHHCAVEPVKANEIYTFRDTLGVEDTLIWTPNANFDYVAGNVLNIETVLNEFFFETSMLSLPDPTATATPEIRWSPDYSLVTTGTIESTHEIWISIDDGGVDSSATKITVRKYTGSNELAFWIKGAYGGGITTKIARADIEDRLITSEPIWSDYPREVTGLTGYDLEVGVDPNVTVTSQGNGWYKVEISDFFSRSYSAGTIMLLPAKNNALHRVAFDYEKRSRLAATAPFNLTQTWLILDSETNKYYKGFVEALSPVFCVGVNKRTEESAQIMLRILEEGLFMPEAWEDPNTAGHFVAWDR